MIEYNNTTHEDFMYFAGDGSWGDASDVVIINVEELDGHFGEFIDELHDYQRPDFMRWYVDNQGHDQLPQDSACEICNLWESGTEKEIIEMMNQPWGLDASKGYSIYGQETGLHDSDFI